MECLNANNFLGHSDWRLPNVLELESLVNAEEYPSADWLNTQGFNNVQADAYWSSTTLRFSTLEARSVYMSWGHVWSENKTWIKPYVWPVRGGQ